MDKGKFVLRAMILVLPITIIIMLLYRNMAQFVGEQQEIGIVINEVMTDNLTVLKNEKGTYSDWIEIFNGSIV